jgi:hypothetical protein
VEHRKDDLYPWSRLGKDSLSGSFPIVVSDQDPVTNGTFAPPWQAVLPITLSPLKSRSTSCFHGGTMDTGLDTVCLSFLLQVRVNLMLRLHEGKGQN